MSKIFPSALQQNYIMYNNTEHQSKYTTAQGKWEHLIVIWMQGCLFFLSYWNVSKISLHWFHKLHFPQIMLVDCMGLYFRRWKPMGGTQDFLQIGENLSWASFRMQKSMWAITSVSVWRQSWKQSYLPILLGYFSKKVYFSLGYRESLCRLTALWGHRKDP